MMITEVISTGDEVVMGDITDTNAAYLCRQLTGLGLGSSRISAVGDDAGTISDLVAQLAARADLCLVTGGLGPTQDDVTAQAFAQALGVPLEVNPRARAMMAAFFGSRGWELTAENEKQALMPKGAVALENLCGTAPGFEVRSGRCLFFVMPGVPEEMRAMFQGQVLPRLVSLTGEARSLLVRRLSVFGLPESVLGHRLADFNARFPGIRLGFKADFPLIQVKLVKDCLRSGGGGEDLEMAAAVAWTGEVLGKKVVSFEGKTLEQEVGRLLCRAGQTLSVAESCTGGLISHKITEVPGASAYFLFSAVTYANAAKEGVLKVERQVLERCGAVHEETARAMALGVKAAGGSDWGIATTGIAGPSGGTLEKPVGTVCIGVAGPTFALARRLVLDTGDRSKNKTLFAAMALDLLRRELTKAADLSLKS